MAIEGGDAAEFTGLAGAIAMARKEAYGDAYDAGKDAKGLNAEAKAIVDYLVANIEVAVAEAPGGTPLVPPGVGSIG